MTAIIAKKDKHIPGLDHLRALAIILVFLYHYGKLFPSPQWVTAICKFGWTGVDLFFVLSGYLISSQLFEEIKKRKNISFYQFYIKRSFRILPAYLCVLALYFFFPFVREREGLAPAWRYLTFTQNIGLDLETEGTFSHAWSLCVEEQFYLLLPLMLAAILRLKLFTKGWVLLAILFIMGMLVRSYDWHQVQKLDAEEVNPQLYWLQWIYYPTWTRLDGLLSGIAIAAIFQYRPAIKTWIFRHSYLFFVLSIGLLASAYIICINQSSFNASVYGFPVIAIGYAFLLAVSLQPSSPLNKRGLPLAATIATLSFGLYLTHKMIIHITQDQLMRIGIEKNSNTAFICCMLTCFAGAYILQQLVEKPFLAVRNKMLSKRPASA